MKKIISIVLAVIMIMTMTACNSTKDSVSDDELINRAMEISKEENNYTYWLFSHDKGIDNSDIIQKEIIFSHNGEEFPSIYDYALVTDFNSIEDFVNNASRYLSKEYMENYLYTLIGLHPTESIPAPLLLESDGSLYKITSANWFLSKNTMTHKKLQKLCYYAQAWNCTLYSGEIMFQDRIEAWVHGPVIPSLYPLYADYKWDKIPQKKFQDKFNDDTTEGVLEAVYNTYGEFSGDQLEQITHSESPWKIARGDLKPWENCNEEITVESMIDYYGKKYEEAQND